jgi:PAS domain S-box-containing protein
VEAPNAAPSSRKPQVPDPASSDHSVALLHALPDLLMICDRGGNCLESYSGGMEDWMRGADVDGRVPEGLSGAVVSALETGQVQTLEYSRQQPGGRRYFEARVSAYGAEGAIVLVRNIDHHRLVEDWLRRLGKAVETMQIGVTISDADGKILYSNPADAEMHGYLVEELIGQNSRIFAPPAAECDPETFDLERTRRWRRESVNRRKNGELFPVQLFSDVVVDAEGRPISRVTWCEDITERKLAEENRNRLLDRIITAQEEERRRIARELHDETGQAMTSMLLKLRAIEDADSLPAAQLTARGLRQVMSQTMKSIAQLARGLHPSILDDLGLIAAIRRYTTEYARVNRLNVNFQTFGMESGTLPQPIQITLYRIVQEALTNIVRHASAKMIYIRLDRYCDAVGLAVVDDGRGFDAEATLQHYAKSNQLGLFGMRERVALLGGTMEVESRVGGGTTVSVHIPLREA